MLGLNVCVQMSNNAFGDAQTGVRHASSQDCLQLHGQKRQQLLRPSTFNLFLDPFAAVGEKNSQWICPHGIPVYKDQRIHNEKNKDFNLLFTAELHLSAALEVIPRNCSAIPRNYDW